MVGLGQSRCSPYKRIVAILYYLFVYIAQVLDEGGTSGFIPDFVDICSRMDT